MSSDEEKPEQGTGASPPGSPPPISRRKRWIFRLVVLVFLLILVEVGLSLYSHFFYPRLTVTDPVLGWKYKPTDEPIQRRDERDGTVVINSISINSEGFRDTEFDRDPATVKVMALGDSMTFGLEADQDEVFSLELEGMLGESLAGQKVDVLNLGITGFGTAQQCVCLEHYEPIFEPDAVILTMLELNDYTDNATVFNNRFVPHFERDADGSLKLRDKPTGMHRVKNALRDTSTLYYALATKIGFLRDALTERMDLDEAGQMRLTQDIVARIVAYTKERDIPLHVYYACLLEWSSTRRDGMAALAKKLDFPFTIIPLVPPERVGGSGHWNGHGHLETAKKMHAALMKDEEFLRRARARKR